MRKPQSCHKRYREGVLPERASLKEGPTDDALYKTGLFPEDRHRKELHRAVPSNCGRRKLFPGESPREHRWLDHCYSNSAGIRTYKVGMRVRA